MTDRPLLGRRVVVTRAREQASDLATRLTGLGAEAVELPVITIVDPSDGGAALREAASRLAGYDWLVFTSANAVGRFLSVVPDLSFLQEGAVRVAAIGPGTGAAVRRWGLEPDLVPERFVAEALVDAFPSPPSPRGGRRVLLPRAAEARDALPEGLRAAGWEVDVVEAYRTERAQPSPDQLARAATADAITFTASSTVTGYLAVAGGDAVPPVVACIGPITADTARRHGLHVDVEADVHTIDGLVEGLVGALRPWETAPEGPLLG
jgi:uroporphyrinogen-III synthase